MSTEPAANRDIGVSYLDEYIIPTGTEVNGKILGGLSGISFDGENFYIICDSGRQSRFFKVKITIHGDTIQKISFLKSISIEKDSIFPDWEAIRFRRKNRFLIASEGAVNRGKMPGIALIDSSGNIQKKHPLPSYFSLENLRNNQLLESLANDGTGGFWTTTESPLKTDAPTPKLFNNSARVRLIHYNAKGNPVQQFFYPLDPLRRLPYLPFAMSGVSAIITYENHFLVLERGFYAGRGQKKFRCRLFEVKIPQTQTKNIRAPREKIPHLDKKLVYDFEVIREKLKHEQVDNLEGMCLGPKLPDGRQTLFVIADDNFNSFSRQYNQIFLMVIKKRKHP